MHPLAVLVIILWLLCIIVHMAESHVCCGLYSELRRMWRAAGIPGRVVAVVMVVMCTQYGGSKGITPVTRLFNMIFWHPTMAWALADQDDDVRDAAASVAAAEADLSAASNLLAAASALIDTQDVWTVSAGWPMADRTPPHAAQNVMGENPWRSNVWINGELFHDHYVAFNASVGTNPAIISIDYTAVNDAGDKARWLESVTTNSYPETSVITLEHGSYTCYWFRCKAPVAITNCVMDWEREVIFGAPTDERGFNIAGTFVVSKDGELWQGRSYTNIVNWITNVLINGVNAVEQTGGAAPLEPVQPEEPPVYTSPSCFTFTTNENDEIVITSYTCEEKAISIPDEINDLPVVEIGETAFFDSSITNIALPEGITKIGSYAFSGCTGLVSMAFPYSLDTIGNYAFNQCSGITNINIQSNVVVIGDGAFKDCSMLSGNIVLPNGLTNVQEYTFSGCTGIASVVFPDGLGSISNSAFYGCSGMTNLALPPNLQLIGTYAFYGCSGILGMVAIPDQVISVSESAFDGCSMFTELVIGAGVTSICDYALQDCAEVDSVYCRPLNAPTLGVNATAGMINAFFYYRDSTNTASYTESWVSRPTVLWTSYPNLWPY